MSLKKYIHPVYISKYNLNHGNQIIILNIPNGGWHYLAVKKTKPSALNSKNNGDLYCLNYIYLCRTKIKPKSDKKVC